MQKSLSDVIDYCFEQLCSQIKRPLFVGVGGDSGSGKSHFATLLHEQFTQAHLDCEVINHDDFLIPRHDRELLKSTYYQAGEFAGKSHWEVLENMFRLAEYEKAIEDLKSGKSIEYFPYDRRSGAISTTARKVYPTEFLLFDTSMLLDKMDFVILVEASQENIIKRKIERDKDLRAPAEIIDMHRKVQGYYWQRARPNEADIIIDNNDFSQVRIIKAS